MSLRSNFLSRTRPTCPTSPARLDAAGDSATFAAELAALIEGGSTYFTLPVVVDGDELVVRAEGGTYRLSLERFDY